MLASPQESFMIYVEIFFLITILFGQIYFFRETLLLIRKLRNIFPMSPWDIGNIKKIETADHSVNTIIVQKIKSPAFEKILTATNAYLVNNYGSSEFNTIQSIAERESELLEGQVTAGIATPLYLGLMGTFLGVILGLSTMIAQGTQQLLEHMEAHINDLLLGVCVAMFVSLIGLGLTTINNVFNLKKAVLVRDEQKTRYFNFLQVYLLPSLDNSLYSALSALKQNINGFNEQFEKNLILFNNSFGKNIGDLASSVAVISDQIDSINENTKIQVEFLTELKHVNYTQIAEANIAVLNKLVDVSPLLVAFTQAQRLLNDNVAETNGFVTKLQDLFNRFGNFEKSINHLGAEINETQLFGADTISIIRKQLSAINRNENIITEYADKAEADVREYLREGTAKIAELRRKIESDFDHAFDFDSKGNVLQNITFLKTMDQTLIDIKQEMRETLAKLVEKAEKPNSEQLPTGLASEPQLAELVGATPVIVAEKRQGRIRTSSSKTKKPNFLRRVWNRVIKKRQKNEQ